MQFLSLLLPASTQPTNDGKIARLHLRHLPRLNHKFHSLFSCFRFLFASGMKCWARSDMNMKLGIVWCWGMVGNWRHGVRWKGSTKPSRRAILIPSEMSSKIISKHFLRHHSVSRVNSLKLVQLSLRICRHTIKYCSPQLALRHAAWRSCKNIISSLREEKFRFWNVLLEAGRRKGEDEYKHILACYQAPRSSARVKQWNWSSGGGGEPPSFRCNVN